MWKGEDTNEFSCLIWTKLEELLVNPFCKPENAASASAAMSHNCAVSLANDGDSRGERANWNQVQSDQNYIQESGINLVSHLLLWRM